ncbi:MAG: helix-turn-helix domain-containing protein [Planctomycetota bacterium]
MSDSTIDANLRLAAAIEKCLAELAVALGEFRKSYRPPAIRTIEIQQRPALPVQPNTTIQPPVKEFLNAAEAAELMGFKVETLYMWRRTGAKGPKSYGKGKAGRWRRSEVEAWLTSQARDTADSLGLKSKKKRRPDSC